MANPTICPDRAIQKAISLLEEASEYIEGGAHVQGLAADEVDHTLGDLQQIRQWFVDKSIHKIN